MVLSEVLSEDYDTLFLPACHVPCGICHKIVLKNLVEKFYNNSRIKLAVCHGPAGLIQTTDENGNSILKIKRITGFTNDEEESVKLDKTIRISLENKLKELGGKFEKSENCKPFIISDGQVHYRILDKAKERKSK